MSTRTSFHLIDNFQAGIYADDKEKYVDAWYRQNGGISISDFSILSGLSIDHAENVSRYVQAGKGGYGMSCSYREKKNDPIFSGRTSRGTVSGALQNIFWLGGRWEAP